SMPPSRSTRTLSLASCWSRCRDGLPTLGAAKREWTNAERAAISPPPSTSPSKTSARKGVLSADRCTRQTRPVESTERFVSHTDIPGADRYYTGSATANLAILAVAPTDRRFHDPPLRHHLAEEGQGGPGRSLGTGNDRDTHSHGLEDLVL